MRRTWLLGKGTVKNPESNSKIRAESTRMQIAEFYLFNYRRLTLRLLHNSHRSFMRHIRMANNLQHKRTWHNKKRIT